MAKVIRIALVGVGNVGRAFLDLIDSRVGLLAERYGLELVLTAVADSRGALIDPAGISPAGLRAHKSAGKSVAEYRAGQTGMSAPDMVAAAPADFLLEAAAVNLRSGQPGLECTRIALRRGMAAVLADKGPMVHAFDELTALAAESKGAREGLARTGGAGEKEVSLLRAKPSRAPLPGSVTARPCAVHSPCSTSAGVTWGPASSRACAASSILPATTSWARW